MLCAARTAPRYMPRKGVKCGVWTPHNISQSASQLKSVSYNTRALTACCSLVLVLGVPPSTPTGLSVSNKSKGPHTQEQLVNGWHMCNSRRLGQKGDKMEMYMYTGCTKRWSILAPPVSKHWWWRDRIAFATRQHAQHDTACLCTDSTERGATCINGVCARQLQQAMLQRQI